MLKLFVWVCCVALLGSIDGWAQTGLYVNVGYNYGFATHKQLDFIIEKYNETNTQLIRPMNHLDHLEAPIVGIAVEAGNKSINLDYTKKSSLLYSTYYDNKGNVQQTDLKVVTSQIGLTFGVFPEPGSAFAMSFGLCAHYLRTNYLLRSQEFGPQYQTWSPAETFDQLTIAPMLEFFFGLTDNIFIRIKPYYQFDAFPVDYYHLHQKLNPNTYQQDKGRDFTGRLNQFVLEGGIVYSFNVGN